MIDMGCFRGVKGLRAEGVKLRYIEIECSYGVLMYFTLICAEIRLEFGLSGIAGCLI